MRNRILIVMTAVLMVLLLFSSCEKMVVDDEKLPTTESDANLILKVRVTGSRADAAPWKTLNFVVYQDGSKIKTVTQTQEDTDFGAVAMTLAPGTYQVMVLGHSSASNPVLSDPQNIKFTNDNGFSDTFVAYQSILVEEKAKTCEMEMNRVSAMVRFRTLDAKPAAVKRARFYYVGGSGAVNAVTGYGVDKSKQVVFVDFPDEMTGKPLQIDLYTFVRSEDDATLNLTINMLDASGDLLSYPGMVEGARELKNVPIKRNQITEYSGYFFSANSDPSGEEDPDVPDDPIDPTGESETSFVLVVNPEWGNLATYNY
ncbi:MAG: FimB/Mfa2 family fimbrial subunit [Prevotella sp.]|nr:FimB/Mfa2 family fimbrial subunit [Prevotella sp.]